MLAVLLYHHHIMTYYINMDVPYGSSGFVD